MRVILDTNIWISYLISKDLEWIDNFFKQDDFDLIFSDRLIEEFLNVAKRPKISKYIKSVKLTEIVEKFNDYGLLIETTSSIEKCRDPNDDFLLELAIDGKANYLITGDKDLLILEQIDNCQIITLLEWKERIR